MQKLLNYFILEQAACALSERRAELALIEWAQDKSAFSFSPLALRGVAKLRNKLGRRNTLTSIGEDDSDIGIHQSQQAILERRRSSTPNIGDYMERVLETSAAGLFSPGNRYISSIYPKYLYAGLPRSYWKLMFKYGLLEEVNIAGVTNSRIDEIPAPFVLDSTASQDIGINSSE